MGYALSLLDKANEKLGSDAATARAADVSPSAITAIRKGRKKMSPELAAIIAAALGDDPDYAVKRVMIENADASMLFSSSRYQSRSSMLMPALYRRARTAARCSRHARARPVMPAATLRGR